MGRGAQKYAPDPKAVYTFLHSKVHGASPGMTVTDPEGRKWSIKQSVEGPVEVMHSRILSALGYHQPPVYFLPSFTLKDEKGTHQERGGRFRPTLPELEEIGDWSWQQNPFVGTKPYQGLLVILLMFGSADLKNSNNSLYAYRRPDGTTERLLFGSRHRQRARRHRALRGDEKRSGCLRAPAVHRRRGERVRGVSVQRLASGAVSRPHHARRHGLGRRR